jgi:hypothetical protein
MKKKYLFIVSLVVMLGTAVSGCYVERGYERPWYHHRYHHDYDHHRDYDRDYDRHY